MLQISVLGSVEHDTQTIFRMSLGIAGEQAGYFGGQQDSETVSPERDDTV